MMTERPSDARIRMALAQFCYAQSIDLEDLYRSLGVEATASDAEAMAHMAGLIDGMNMAATRIRQHGIDDWAKAN